MKHKNESLCLLTIEAEVFHNVAIVRRSAYEPPTGLALALSNKFDHSLFLESPTSAKTLIKNLHLKCRFFLSILTYAFKIELTRAVL